MRSQIKKILITLMGTGSSAVLLGPAVTVFSNQDVTAVNDTSTLTQVNDSATISKTINFSKTLSDESASVVLGGNADFSAKLGFAHSNDSGRGWMNMFWGNQWDFNWNSVANENLPFRDIGLNRQQGLSNGSVTKDRSFTYSDHRREDIDGNNKNAVILNKGSLNSTLAYNNYEINVNYDHFEGSAPVMKTKLQSRYQLGKNPNLQDDVSSSFLLLMYSMFITGEGSKLTGDPTYDTSPEFLFVNPVFQLTRTSAANKFTTESIAAAIGSGILGSIIGGLSGGGIGAIAGFAGPALVNMFVPQLNGIGQDGLNTTLALPSYVPIPKGKSFLWDEGITLKNKYFTDKSYDITKFFVTDITLSSDATIKLAYDGWNGWKPFIQVNDPTISFSYTAEGTKTTTVNSTYNYSNWIIEKR